MHAWNVMRFAQGSIFWVFTIFWLISYIKLDSRAIQKYYFRAIAWGIPLSWAFALWSMIAFIVGGVTDNGSIGWNMFYSCTNWGILAGL